MAAALTPQAHDADYDRLRGAIAGERLPCALVDLAAFDRNAERAAAAARAGGKRLRIATKSLRVPALIRRALERAGEAAGGLMAFSAEEAAWLAGRGFDDILVAYPTLQERALAALAAAARAGAHVAITADSPPHLAAIDRAGRAAGLRLRTVLDLDVSLSPLGGAIHIGARRSPLRTPGALAALARAARGMGGVEVVGLMGYEAHIAGVPDGGEGASAPPLALRLMKRVAVPAAARLRAAAAAALRAEGLALEIVNGGGTGSLAAAAADPVLTEVTAGSALFAPHLFDGFAAPPRFEPAAFFALEVARTPAPGIITCAGGGYVASGAAGKDRLPLPWLPRDMRLLAGEGAGEVQTPLDVRRARRVPGPGEPVFFRHAKAGELMERFAEVALVEDGKVVARAETYRGMGKTFF
jgi:D-serine deaminase-like pyridoxal phosphate-dependent protein